MVKNGYYGNEGLSLAWDLRVIFLGVRNLWPNEIKKNIKILALKVLWKNVWVVSLYTHFRAFLVKKRYYRMGGRLDFCVNLLAMPLHIQLLRKDWIEKYVFKIDRKSVLFREIYSMKNSLKQGHFYNSITIAKKISKIFIIIILNL